MQEITELIRNGDNEKLNQKINNDPSLANGKTDQGISFLQFAAYCRNEEAIEIFKTYKNDLDIFEAASVGDQERIRQYIVQDPEWLNAHSTDGFTLLGLASYFGHLSLVKYLLDKGADPNLAANNPLQVTPLHSACAISNLDIAKQLIQYGADVNAKQMQNVAPLHSAAHNGQTKLVKLLINNGADIHAKTDNGQTPLSMAEEKGFSETVEIIKQYNHE